MVDIFFILSSKPHYPHFLRRYYKFILACKEKNKDLNKEIYTEKHHICPKAEDLFPEYQDFKKFPWNQLKLTPRQHRIAHLILQRSYIKSQQQIDNKIKRYKNQSQKMKGLCQHYLPDGTHYGMLYRDDPIIQELNLIPFKEENRQIAIDNCYRNHKDPVVQAKKSKTMSKKSWFYDSETKENFRLEPSEVPSNFIPGRYKDPETMVKRIVVNNGIENLHILPEELSSFISNGWSRGMKPQKKRVYSKL